MIYGLRVGLMFGPQHRLAPGPRQGGVFFIGNGPKRPIRILIGLTLPERFLERYPTMFRTDLKTGVVCQADRPGRSVGRRTPSGPLSFEEIPLGSLQRDSHDHAPCSTRPRWGLCTTTRSRGGSSEGRDRPLRVRSGNRSVLGIIHVPGLPVRGRVSDPGRCSSLAGASGHARGSSTAGTNPEDLTIRPAEHGRKTAIGSSGRDPGLEGSPVPRSRSWRGCDRGAGLLGGTLARHRPRRDQPIRHGCLPHIRSHGRTIGRPHEESSPAPVAGGGAQPLHLQGDRSARCRPVPGRVFEPSTRGGTADRRSHAGTTPPSRVLHPGRFDQIIPPLEPFPLAGVVT